MIDFQFASKRALVVGSMRGLGETLAEGLARAGAKVALAVREPENDEIFRNAFGPMPELRVPLIDMDAARVSSIRAGVAQAAKTLGGLDILITHPGLEMDKLALDVEEEDWDTILDTNLKGVFFQAQAAARIMSEGSGGAILNISALDAFRGIPNAVAYGCSKSGLLGMTRALAAEWGRHGIRVNAIAYGHNHPDMPGGEDYDEEWRARVLSRTPISRFGNMRDIISAAIFLVSEGARYITGTCLPVDGGAHVTV